MEDEFDPFGMFSVDLTAEEVETAVFDCVDDGATTIHSPEEIAMMAELAGKNVANFHPGNVTIH